MLEDCEGFGGYKEYIPDIKDTKDLNENFLGITWGRDINPLGYRRVGKALLNRGNLPQSRKPELAAHRIDSMVWANES
jgi:hypothetical protein